MKHRLTIDERSEFAFKLRSQILSIENPNRLAALSDSQFQPHRLAIGIYAFEFFLDRYRIKFRSKSAEDNIVYNIGWSKESIMMDEEVKRPEKIVRMAATLFMITLEERGEITEATTLWIEKLSQKGLAFNRTQLEMFLFEIFYELSLEISNELFRDLK